MAIRDWPAAERPRERLAQQGAAALVRRRTAGDIPARRRSRQERGRSGPRSAGEFRWRLGDAWGPRASKTSPDFPGIGPAKAAQLAATLELARRALAGSIKAKDSMASPREVRDWLRLSLGNLQHEVFVALWLDAQNRLIASEELFRGTLDANQRLSA
jgi:DNA repair protein RadC